MWTLFLDESGDHSLTKIDPQYPIFVLGGIIADDQAINHQINPGMKQLKKDIFDSDTVILHTADITRNRKDFTILMDSTKRQEFYTLLNQLMKALTFQVVACVIDKPNHSRKYAEAAIDPYVLSLNILVERFYYEVRNHQSTGTIIAESRNPFLDEQLTQAWNTIRRDGTRYVRGSDIRKTITSLNIYPKLANIAGLQLADLVVSPIGRHYLGKNPHEDYAIIEQKFRRGPRREIDGYGLIVLPKS
ncbi:MAG: DUF3800 domain-containing protein [Sulfobacillus acidophilus]|uniref:DUF3800 domain-containing protein n=1 Tax=Sulfobacillus acidophilus TaxID=53633 RepID=A0A2T2WCK5_9FIRM|nr:MAG: DUF3800 domain-containing protein [Sulfobacillus acidophilus]